MVISSPKTILESKPLPGSLELCEARHMGICSYFSPERTSNKAKLLWLQRSHRNSAFDILFKQCFSSAMHSSFILPFTYIVDWWKDTQYVVPSFGSMNWFYGIVLMAYSANFPFQSSVTSYTASFCLMWQI